MAGMYTEPNWALCLNSSHLKQVFGISFLRSLLNLPTSITTVTEESHSSKHVLCCYQYLSTFREPNIWPSCSPDFAVDRSVHYCPKTNHNFQKFFWPNVSLRSTVLVRCNQGKILMQEGRIYWTKPEKEKNQKNLSFQDNRINQHVSNSILKKRKHPCKGTHLFWGMDNCYTCITTKVLVPVKRMNI